MKFVGEQEKLSLIEKVCYATKDENYLQTVLIEKW